MNIQLNSGLLIQKVVDEVVILEPESGDYYTLNPSGAEMLTLLQQGQSTKDIAQHMSREFDVDVQTVEADLHSLLLELQQHGLAHTADA